MASGFQFNLKKSGIYQAVGFRPRSAGVLKKLFGFAFIVVFVLFLYGFSVREVFVSTRILLGLSLLFLSLSLLFLELDWFFNSKLKRPGIKDSANLAEFLGYESALAVSDAIRFAKKKNLSKVDSSLLLYFLIRNNPRLNFIFNRALVDVKKLQDMLLKSSETLAGEFDIFSRDFQSSVNKALSVSKQKGHGRIGLGDMFTALAEHDLIFKKFLINNNLKLEDIEDMVLWLERIERKINERRRFWSFRNLLRFGSVGREWASGYTVNLDKFSVDLSQTARLGGFDDLVGHESEIQAAERVLSKGQENNVLLVGEVGSGRRIIIEAMAKRSVFAETVPELRDKRIVEIDMAGLLTQAQSAQEAGEILKTIFDEVAYAGNVILVIHDFHNYVGGSERPGIVDISGIISSYLNLPQFQLIAVTSFKGLHKYIEQNPSILSFFEKVEVSEISNDETLVVLENLAFRLESKHKQFISYQALRDIIDFSDKYMADIPFPEKAIDLLDEVASYVSQIKGKVLLPKHVAKIVSDKTQIPVGEVESTEKEKLLNLEELIHKRIINQDTAVSEVAEALRRARTEVAIKKGPMGAFLFLGPTGVGKTETAKSLAEIYFGSEKKIIRLDMSEFQEVSDIPRLIGSAGEEGLLTTQVMENPFSLVLLDEIEKSHPNILNLFLQVLDEGFVTDGLGRKVDFKNTIIICTSNAGYMMILDALKQNKKMSDIREDLINHLFKEKIFRPEFINRFDAVVLFQALSRENLLDIAGLLLGKLQKNLATKNIEFVVSEDLKKQIVELSYDPKFGARQMNRVIQDKIGNVFAKALLANKIKRGDKVEVDAESFELKIK